MKFRVGNQSYKFITLPNGLSSGPRIFTKLMKPVYTTLKTRGHVSSGYSFLLGVTSVQCHSNVNSTYSLFGDLGFNVSKEKSVTQPTQVIEHLGCVLNSTSLTAELPKLTNGNKFLFYKQGMSKCFSKLMIWYVTKNCN